MITNSVPTTLNSWPDDPAYYVSPEDRYRDAQGAAGDAPAVSAPAAKNFIFVGIFLLIIAIIVYEFFTGGQKETNNMYKNAFSPTHEPNGSAVVIPPPQPIITPPPPQAPPTEPVANTNSSLFANDNSSDRIKRIHSDMLITRPGLLNDTELGTRA